MTQAQASANKTFSYKVCSKYYSGSVCNAQLMIGDNIVGSFVVDSASLSPERTYNLQLDTDGILITELIGGKFDEMHPSEVSEFVERLLSGGKIREQQA